MKFTKKKDNKLDRKLHIITRNEDFGYVEAYKSLRTNLKFVSVSGDYKKIAVTSSIPGEGKSNVAINLAISLAEDGSKVLVVDCDLRKPVIHKYLRISQRGKGLTSILSGETSVEEVTKNFTDIGVSVICAGAVPPNPAEIMASKKMQEFIEKVEDKYDYIIFDTPPVSVVTDAAVLSRYVDGILLVVRQKFVTTETAKIALKNLQAVNANVIGTVLNGFDTKQVGKGNGYYYSYDYNYSN